MFSKIKNFNANVTEGPYAGHGFLRSMDRRLPLFYAGSGLVFVAILALRFIHTAQETRTEQARDLNQYSALALAETTSRGLVNLVDQGRIFAASRASQKPADAQASEPLASLLNSQPFLLSVLQVHRDSDTGWSARWIERSQKAEVEKWPFKIEQTLVEPAVRTHTGDGIQVIEVDGPRGGGRLTLVTSSVLDRQNKLSSDLIVMILDRRALDQALRLNRGTGGEALVVGESNQILASSGKVQADYLSGLGKSGMGDEVEVAEQRYLRATVPVLGTNLSIVALYPTKIVGTLWFFTIVSWLALALGLWGLGFWVVRRWTGERELYHERVRESLSTLGAGQVPEDSRFGESHLFKEILASANSNKVAFGGKPLAEKTSREASPSSLKSMVLQKMGQDLAKELREPLLALLGQVSLAKGRAESDVVRFHLGVMEKDIRGAKGIAERLFKLNHLEKLETEPANFSTFVEALAQRMQAEHAGGALPIRIRTDILPSAWIRLEAGLLNSSLEGLVKFACSQLRTRGMKDLVLRLEPYHDKFQEFTRLILSEPTSQLVRENQPTLTGEEVANASTELAFAVAVLDAHSARLSLRDGAKMPWTVWVDFPAIAESDVGIAAPTVIVPPAVDLPPVMTPPPIEHSAETTRLEEALLDTPAFAVDGPSQEDEFYSDFKLDSTLIPPLPETEGVVTKVSSKSVRKPRLRI